MSSINWEQRDFAQVAVVDELLARIKSVDAKEYGGRYVSGGRNILHINVLQNKGTFLGLSDQHNVRLHFVRYSYQQLIDSQEIVDSLIGKISLQESMIDIVNNKIVIAITNDHPEVRAEILHELNKLIENREDMFVFQKVRPFTEASWMSEMMMNEDDIIEDDESHLKAAITPQMKPGEWLGMKDMKGKVYACRSLSFGVYMGGKPFYVTAGHKWKKKDIGKTIYYTANSSSTNEYVSDTTDYAALKAVGDGKKSKAIGKVYGRKCDGQYDFCSISRSAGDVSTTAYNNYKLKYIGGEPEVGETVRFTGIANRNRKGGGSSTYTTCLSVNKSYISLDGTKIKNGISVEGHGIIGTSGGPLMYMVGKDVAIAGIASYPDDVNNRVYFTKVDPLFSKYKLTPRNLIKI